MATVEYVLEKIKVWKKFVNKISADENFVKNFENSFRQNIYSLFNEMKRERGDTFDELAEVLKTLSEGDIWHGSNPLKSSKEVLKIINEFDVSKIRDENIASDADVQKGVNELKTLIEIKFISGVKHLKLTYIAWANRVFKELPDYIEGAETYSDIGFPTMFADGEFSNDPIFEFFDSLLSNVESKCESFAEEFDISEKNNKKILKEIKKIIDFKKYPSGIHPIFSDILGKFKKMNIDKDFVDVFKNSFNELIKE